MARGYKLSKRVWVEKIPRLVLFVDTETTEQPNGKLDLLLGCYEVWCVSRKGRRIKILSEGVFDTEAEFHSVMRDSADCRVVAHNWNFDASVLRIASSEHREAFGYSINFEKSIISNETASQSPFFLRLEYNEGGYVELLDNGNYYPMPLRAIGDSLSIPKLDIPETSERESMIAYCQRDVEILREAYFGVFEFCLNFGTTPSITTPSAAMRVFRKHFYEKIGDVQGSQHIEAVNKAEREAYHGGRTDTFYKGRPLTDNPIYKYDVNSLYPTCMLGDIPIRYLQRVRGSYDYSKGLEGGSRLIGLHDVSLCIPEGSRYGFLGLEGIRTDSGLIFPVGEFRCWVWQPLYEIALAQGYVKECHRIYLYQSEPLFRGYIESLYALRQQYKQAGNFAYDMLCKLFMNSLYGKFGQRAYGKWQELESDSDEYHSMHGEAEGILRTLGEVEDRDTPSDYLQLGERIWRYDDDAIGDLARSSVCSIAGYITALGRASVWRAMASVIDSGGQIYMCDTDSVVCDVRLPDSMVSDSELGKWKLEGISEPADCDFVAPKHYIYQNQIKLKGVRNPVIGALIHKQTRFPRFMTDLSSKSLTRQANLEDGASISYIESEPTGINHKRREIGEGLPTLPFVI